MNDDDISKMLGRAGIPKAYRRKGQEFRGTPQRDAAADWLTNGGAKKLRTGSVAVFLNHSEEGHWVYNLTQIYLTLQKIPTKRFDAWQLQTLSQEAWNSLENCRVLFIENALTKLSVSDESRTAQGFFYKMALERGIGICFLNDRSKVDAWDSFPEQVEALIRRRTAKTFT